MSSYRIKITETTTTQGEAAFDIEADTPQSAAALVSAAYYSARAINSLILVLPDGQREVLDGTNTVDVGVVFSLLNSAGEVEHEIAKSDLRRSMI